MKLDQTHIAQWHSRRTESLSLDIGYRSPQFESREVIGLFQWWTFRTRIHFGVLLRGAFPRRFLARVTATERLPSIGYTYYVTDKCQQLANRIYVHIFTKVI